MAQYMVIFLMPFYLADVLLLASDVSGVILLIHPMVMMLVAGFSGGASDRWGHQPLTTAGLIVSALTLWLLSRLGLSSGLTLVVAGLAGIGLGSALYVSPSNSAVMGAVPKEYVGIASGMVATARALGQTLGVTLAGNLVSARTVYYAGFAANQTESYVMAQGDAFRTGAVIVAVTTAVIFIVRRAGGWTEAH
jgi:hypothetical protein